MSNDLISRKQLLDRLRGNVLIDVTPALETEINAQPTAYDVDRIVEEIKGLGGTDIMEDCGEVFIHAESVIDIVEGGGIDG